MTHRGGSDQAPLSFVIVYYIPSLIQAIQG